LPAIPGGKVKSYLEHRQISADGVITTKYNFPVKRGMIIRIHLSDKKAPPSGLELIYEDEVLLAVNKPAGLLSVATDTEKEKNCVPAVERQPRISDLCGASA
jgi:Pseudouridylate synthases, 23S RNA-specific